MSETPKVSTWMPFYVGDYLADTTHLSTAEHGAYLLLILTYWRNEEPLQDDDARMARIVGATPREWAKLRPAVAPFFTISEGRWQHKRVDAELANAKERRTKAKERSDAANAAKAAKEAAKEAARLAGGSPSRTPTRTADAETSEVTSEVTSSPSPSPLREEIDRAPSLSVGPAQAPASQQDLLEIPDTLDRRRARRLPDDWPLTVELTRIAQDVRTSANLPPIDIATEHAKFVDYWHAKGGKDAAKRDWLATWRNWIRNANAPRQRGNVEAFGAGMRGQIADAMSMLDDSPEEAPQWPALPAT